MASLLRSRILRQTGQSVLSAHGHHTPSISRPLLRSVLALRPSTQLTSFHSSSRKPILPALPQRIEGTANEPVKIYDPSPAAGSYHWTFERLISVGLIPLTIAPFAAGTLNPLMDAILCGTILLHSHIGFQSIIIDYVPTRRLPRVRKLFWHGLQLATVLVGVGLYQFETNDVGVTEALKRIWKA